MSNNRPIIFAIDKNYIQHLSVALESLYQNNSYEIPVFILYSGLDNDDICNLNFVSEKYNQSIIYNEIDMEKFKGFKENFHFTKAMYFRLLIPDILNEDIKSAIYIDSDVVINGDIKYLFELDLKDNKLDITVNHSKDVIELEFLYLQKKRKEINAHLTSRQIDNKYKKLIKLTKRFDMFLYKNNYKKAKINSLLDFYKLRTEMKYNSIESYYCSSTENIIVWGIQSGNLNKMMKYLTADNFLISTVENMIDLYKHHGNSKKVNKDLVIKVSKYIYRIFFCLNYYLIKSSDVVRKNFDDYLKKTNNINFSNLKKLIDEIIYLRSNIETFDKKKLDYYMNKLKIFTDIFKLNTPLNFNKYNPIFNYFNNFDSRLSFLFTKKKFTKKKFTKKKITKRKITKRKITKKKNEINFFTKKFSYKNTHVKKFVNRLDRMESKI